MGVVGLDRFKLEGFLGSGSDYEAHAATDSHTGRPVVIKRPNPDYITRKLHHGVDRLSEQLIEVHAEVADSVPCVAHLICYTEVARHDSYFGDSLDESYRVLVVERAQGLPLVSDIRDKFRGVPIGLPQNLFALHPLVPHPEKGHFTVQQQLIDVVEAFHHKGHLLLDMRPQNVYYDPGDGRIAVIDIGTMPSQGPAAQGKVSAGSQPRDINDCCAELFKFYISPDVPPESVRGYAEPTGMRHIPHYIEQLDALIRCFSTVDYPGLKEASVSTLQKIRQRAYTSFDDFRRDFGQCLNLVRERNEALPDHRGSVDVWDQAVEMLSDAYWNRFLFDPDSDLANFRAARANREAGNEQRRNGFIPG